MANRTPRSSQIFVIITRYLNQPIYGLQKLTCGQWAKLWSELKDKCFHNEVSEASSSGIINIKKAFAAATTNSNLHGSINGCWHTLRGRPKKRIHDTVQGPRSCCRPNDKLRTSLHHDHYQQQLVSLQLLTSANTRLQLALCFCTQYYNNTVSHTLNGYKPRWQLTD